MEENPFLRLREIRSRALILLWGQGWDESIGVREGARIENGELSLIEGK